MTDRVQLAFLLAIVALAGGHDAPLAAERNSPDEYIVYIANLDKAFDALLPHIKNAILNNGMDPMELVDISDSLIPILPGHLKGKIDLKNGWLQEMSKIRRAKHVTAIYTNKRIILDMDLGFDLLDFNYEYYLQYLLAKRQGDLNGRFHNCDIKVIVTIDLANYRMSFDSIKFVEVGKYDIKFEGNLLDPILNAATKVVTVIFKKQVLAHIEDRSSTVFSAIINEWNKMFPRPNRTRLIEEWIHGRMLDVQYY